ncbi:MAG: ABC transporter substrate-binding protein [Spirochaetota bacterium]
MIRRAPAPVLRAAMTLVMGASLTLLLWAGPGGPQPLTAGNTTIRFWHILGYHAGPVVEEMAAEYNRSRKGVTVKADFQGFFEEAQVKLMAAAVSRRLPEVAMIPAQYLQAWVSGGLVQPLNRELPPDLREDIREEAWGLVSREGKRYGVPFCVFTDVFLYNRDAFAEAGLDPDRPPGDWEELVSAGKRLASDEDGDGEPERFALTFYLDGVYGITPILYSLGGALFGPGGDRVVLTSPAMEKTVGMVRDLALVHRIMPRNWTALESAQAFLTGRLAMGWVISPGIPYSEENLPWDLGVANMPLFGHERAANLYGTALVAFASGRKQRRAALDFMFHLVSRENDIRMFERAGFVPVRRSSYGSLQVRAFLKENPRYRVPLEALEYARPLPSHPRFLQIDREIAHMLQRVILAGADPARELRETEDRINRMLR